MDVHVLPSLDTSVLSAAFDTIQNGKVMGIDTFIQDLFSTVCYLS
jgi:hypothetical protein